MQIYLLKPRAQWPALKPGIASSVLYLSHTSVHKSTGLPVFGNHKIFIQMSNFSWKIRRPGLPLSLTSPHPIWRQVTHVSCICLSSPVQPIITILFSNTQTKGKVLFIIISVLQLVLLVCTTDFLIIQKYFFVFMLISTKGK